MPKAIFPILAAAVLSAALATGCASQSGPGYDNEQASQPRCPRDYKLKCTKRTASPEECACVTRASIEETIEAVIGVP